VRIESTAILTTAANELVGAVHDRMPVILTLEAAQIWLDPDASGETLKALLRPYPAETMMCRPVGPAVNSVRAEGPQCIEPLAPPSRTLF
jgi:putative SOS response-associated peptidase YedK